MELKVWVEGIQRIVCGVTEVTTCQDVVFALAHATGKTGRFTLIERWRNNERLLAPHENPLKILMKWGEYSSDVQFILQRSEQKKDGQTTQQQQQQQQQNNNNNNNPQPNGSPPTNQPQQQLQQQLQNQNHPQSQQQLLRQQQKLNQLNGNVDADVKSKLVQSNNLKNSGSDPSYGKQQQQQPPAELITNSLLLDRGKETRKSLNSGTPPSAKTPTAIHTNTRSNGTSGATTVVKVVDNHAGLTLKSLPPQQQPQKSPNNSTSSSNSSSSNSSNNPVEATYASVIKKPKGPAVTAVHPAGPAIVGEFNAADLRNSLDRKLNGLLYSNGVGTAIHHGGGTTIVGATLKDNSRYGGNVSGHQHLSSNDSLLLDSSSISSVSSGGNHTLLTSPTPQNLSGSNNASPITGISSNGALVPPPYRDPPPPRNSPLSHKLLLENQLNNNPNASISSTGSNSSSQIISPSSSTSQMNNLNVNRKLEKDSINMNLALAAASAPTSTGSGGSIGGGSSIGSGSSASNANELLLLSELNLNDGQTSASSSSAAAAAQYRDLVQLIKYQREKINTQQADLSKYDSEIQYLESRSREQQEQLDAITQEISKTDALYRAGAEQLQTLQYVEEEGELVRQQEKTLKSEITLLRSKLANCETELLQCKNKIRLLMDEIQVEQRKYCRQYDPNHRAQLERNLMSEVDRIQLEIDLAIQSTDQASKTTEKLKSEVAHIEGNIADKKKQVEQLVHEMKEVNLQSLASVAPADEVRHLLEVGSVKPGSTRRMIGSPRQLENAVPTSKNPHGVWV
ncbi:probable serine/threonine-protein kinase tsuA isoform X2 [Culex quinquefasciatus]|uniref:probable serine/threonine-protein kinase tsuA isoform X2 n=1 Tax=Culex quinquefasciatus TaxID=7176 RepID=UPI0018E39925|nr:probable serine/threonine-protein kinase tsuA isoform X2 [Culex quinquefasciatus]